MKSFKEKAISSFYWSALERFGQQAIQFFFSLILARLLEPGDFGLMGMLSLFLILAQGLVDSGFGQALIQKKEVSDRDKSTVFWFNLAVGVLMTAVIFVSAPWIAGFYGQPILIPLTRLISLQLLISSFGVVHLAMLSKGLFFKRRAVATMAAVIGSGVLSVWMSFQGYGVWTLVWMQVSYTLIMTIGAWIAYAWKPGLLFCPKSFNALYSFGSKIFATTCLDNIFVYLSPMLIGKFYNPTALGYFSRARQLVQVTSNSISGVVGQVNFPLVAGMQHEPVRMIRFFRKVLVLGVLAIAPIMIGMMAASREMVEVLLGEKWLPCVPYIVPACLIGLAFPIQYLNLNVLLASGRSGLVLKLEVVKKIFVALFLAVTVSQGIMALVWGQAAAALIALILNSISVGKVFGYGVFKQARDLAGPLTVCVIMGASVFFVSRLEVALLLKLALQIITGGAGYLVLLYALFLIAPRSVCGEVIHAGLKSAGSRLRGIAERR